MNTRSLLVNQSELKGLLQTLEESNSRVDIDLEWNPLDQKMVALVNISNYTHVEITEPTTKEEEPRFYLGNAYHIGEE